jgi:hypothetical protein
VCPIRAENKQGITNGVVGLAGPDQKQGRIIKGLTSRTVELGWFAGQDHIYQKMPKIDYTKGNFDRGIQVCKPPKILPEKPP